MLELLNKADEIAGNNRLLVLGDFNVPKVDWLNNETLTGADAIEVQTLANTTDNLWYQHVTQLTRFRNNQASTLDLIFTKEEDDVKNIEVLPPLGNSDHGVVIADVVCEWKSKVERKPARLYSKGNYKLINEGLNRINWEIEFEGKSVQECWEIFKAKLRELVEKHVPMTRPRDYNEPWMNKKLMKFWRKKHFAWKRFTERDSYEAYREYRKNANYFKSIARKTKRAYERKLARDVRKNRRAFFRYVNSKLTVRPEMTEIQRENGELVDEVKEMCGVVGS